VTSPFAELALGVSAHAADTPVAVLDGEQTTWHDLSRRAAELRSVLARETSAADLVCLRGLGVGDHLAAYLALAQLGRAVALPGPHLDDESMLRSIGVSVQLGEGGLQRVAPGCPWRRDGQSEGFALVLLTSGTTGSPQAVLLSEDSLLWNLWNTASIADEVLLGSVEPPGSTDALVVDIAARSALGLCFFTGMPLHTIAGISVLHRAMLFGEPFAAMERFDASVLAAAVARGQLSNLGLSASMGRQLLRAWRAPGATPAPTSSLLSIGLGGGAVPPALAEALEAAFGCAVTIGYGSTELGGVALMSRPTAPAQERHTTIGRPLASVEVRVDDDGAGGARLWCASPARAAAVFATDGTPIPLERWFDTADLVLRQPGGAYEILGRADHVILRGARRVDPARIEHVLETLPGVDRAAVLGVPGHLAGELDIVTVLQGELDRLDFASIRRHCQAQLDLWELPRRAYRADRVPVCDDGYVRRGALAAAIAGLTEQEASTRIR
jgi:acyl-CoA synthetase (AMP-forming)/AMP-acid ligase II